MSDARELTPEDLTELSRLSDEDKADLDRELEAANRRVWDPTIETFRDWGVKGAVALKTKVEATLLPMIRRTNTASGLAHVYTALRQIRDAMSEATKLLDEQYQNLGQEIIPAAFEREKISSFTTLEGYRVTISVALKTSIKADQKEAAHQWLRDNGLEARITQTVNSGTLNAAGKTFIDEGRDLPEELFHAYYQPNTSITKVK
jgi:hypothetical protein